MGKHYKFKLFDLRSFWLRPAALEDDFYYWNTETDESTWDIEVGMPCLDGDIPVAVKPLHVSRGSWVDVWPQWWILWPECFYDIPWSSSAMNVNRDLTSIWNLFVLFVLCFVAWTFKILSNKDNGHLGSRYVYINIYIYMAHIYGPYIYLDLPIVCKNSAFWLCSFRTEKAQLFT